MSRRIFFSAASFCLLTTLAATTAQAAGSYVRLYLVDSLVLPQSNSEYAIDVDGNGSVDNNLGSIVGALNGSGSLDWQASVSAAVASGSIVNLVRLQSTDANFANDPAAQAAWCTGLPTPTPPLFDGTDNVACDTMSDTFIAALSGGNFVSAAPATTPNPIALELRLALGTSTFTLPVWNARLSFTTDGSGHLQTGQINGSVPHTNFEFEFSQAWASSCNASIQSNPASDNAKACINLFDGGCTGFPAYAGDGQIEVCEVQENSLIQALLAPDVQVTDGGNVYDANSLGVRFTAIVNDRVFTNGFDP